MGLVADVNDAFARQDVNDLFVCVGVERRPAFLDGPHELCEVAASVTRIDQQFETPTFACGCRPLFGLVYRDFVVGSKDGVGLGRGFLTGLGRCDGHDHKLIPSGIDHVATLTGWNQHSTIGKQGVPAIRQCRIPAATDDEQHLFGGLVVKGNFTILTDCDKLLCQVLASDASVDGRPRVRAGALDSDVANRVRIDDERAI